MSKSTAVLQRQIRDQERLIAAFFKFLDQTPIAVGAGSKPRRKSKGRKQ